MQFPIHGSRGGLLGGPVRRTKSPASKFISRRTQPHSRFHLFRLVPHGTFPLARQEVNSLAHSSSHLKMTFPVLLFRLLIFRFEIWILGLEDLRRYAFRSPTLPDWAAATSPPPRRVSPCAGRSPRAGRGRFGRRRSNAPGGARSRVRTPRRPGTWPGCR